jgi:RNA polymerase sigma-70 factor (ECF subfamily)
VILAAGSAEAGAQAALEKLCRTYWYPLYAFVRRRGYESHEAQDLTQEFFARLLERNSLQSVDRSKGKFRSFLLGALEHFLANEWRRAHAQKRGGKAVFVSLDEDPENQYQLCASSSLTPEQLFEQQWATRLLEEVLGSLREEFMAAGKGPLFEQLKIFLTGEKRSVSYAELAIRLQSTEPAIKMAVSRMRQRYGQLLRAEIAKTVSSPEEVEEELRGLFAALNY